MNVLKSVSLSGNLKDGKILYTCYPNNEFSQQKWKLAIQAVVFDSSEVISKTCLITCNFVTNKKRSANGDVTIYQQPLNLFHLKTFV